MGVEVYDLDTVLIKALKSNWKVFKMLLYKGKLIYMYILSFESWILFNKSWFLSPQLQKKINTESKYVLLKNK